MFVACSESIASAAFVAAFPTAYVLQTLVGPPHDLDADTRATLEHGVLGEGVRHLVVCGHDGCRVAGGARASGASQRWAVDRCRALQADERMGRMLRRAGVTMRALWIDEASHEIYTCSFEGLPPRRMEAADLAAMFSALDEVSA
jgi:carbonic anhydrase